MIRHVEFARDSWFVADAKPRVISRVPSFPPRFLPFKHIIFYSFRITVPPAIIFILPAPAASAASCFVFHFAASAGFLHPVVRSRTANVSAWILMLDPRPPPFHPLLLGLPSSPASPVIPASFAFLSSRPRHSPPLWPFPRTEFAGDRRNANNAEVVWDQGSVLSLHFHKIPTTAR